jgi:hypothetical protein
MPNAARRSEVLRRISAGELPVGARFVVVQASAGDGACHGCGETLSAGQSRCVVDCATGNRGPFPMHARCFLVWSEACMRTADEEVASRLEGVNGATSLTKPPETWRAVGPVETFCQMRLALLNDQMRRANDFAESVRHMRHSGASAARAACERARHEAHLAREAYDAHVKDHGC